MTCFSCSYLTVEILAGAQGDLDGGRGLYHRGVMYQFLKRGWAVSSVLGASDRPDNEGR